MKIEINEKIRPFSHRSGVCCLIPGSEVSVQVFAALLRVNGLSDMPLAITGPIKEFTVQIDLEKQVLWVWGIAQEGHYRFGLQNEEGSIVLFMDRCPANGIEIGRYKAMRKDKIVLCAAKKSVAPLRMEKLFLGNHKAQDWDYVWRRMDLKEIAPALFLLGQQTPFVQEAQGPIANLIQTQLSLFVRVGLSDLLVPRLEDLDYQGIVPSNLGQGDPNGLLRAAYLKMRSFLLAVTFNSVQILPDLPIDWDAGRAVCLQEESVGEFALEWSRSQMRKMIVRALKTQSLSFCFAKPICRYRLNGVWTDNGAVVDLEEGKVYFFDRFEKH